MISIKQFPPEIEITTTGSDSGSCLLLEPSQRQLLAWFAREKPQMVREAMGVDKVIEELETRKNEINIARKQNPHLSGGNLVIKIYDDVIALLKGEGGCK